MASRFSRTYSSRKTTQEHMLTWVLRQKLWEAVMKIQVPHDGEARRNDSDADASTVKYRHFLQQPLALMPESLPPTRGLNNQALRIWRDTVLSKMLLFPARNCCHDFARSCSCTTREEITIFFLRKYNGNFLAYSLWILHTVFGGDL